MCVCDERAILKKLMLITDDLPGAVEEEKYGATKIQQTADTQNVI